MTAQIYFCTKLGDQVRTPPSPLVFTLVHLGLEFYLEALKDAI